MESWAACVSAVRCPGTMYFWVPDRMPLDLAVNNSIQSCPKFRCVSRSSVQDHRVGFEVGDRFEEGTVGRGWEGWIFATDQYSD